MYEYIYIRAAGALGVVLTNPLPFVASALLGLAASFMTLVIKVQIYIPLSLFLFLCLPLPLVLPLSLCVYIYIYRDEYR